MSPALAQKLLGDSCNISAAWRQSSKPTPLHWHPSSAAPRPRQSCSTFRRSQRTLRLTPIETGAESDANLDVRSHANRQPRLYSSRRLSGILLTHSKIAGSNQGG